MKKYIYSFLALLVSLSSFAQIPNSGFESWNTTSITLPTGWQVFGSASQATPATNGTYAVRIERSSANLNEPGAILYGDPQDGNIFLGGIPFADRPDSLVANFKYSIPTGDSAWVLFKFKKNGIDISNDLYYITGNNTSNFSRKAFAVNYTSGLTPDSLILGFTSTNPDSNFVGGYVIVDDVHFTNTILTVPNGDFESWVTINDEEPVSWITSNGPLLGSPTLPVTKTTDSYNGTYAIRIENVTMGSYYAMGYALSGPQGNNGPAPGFPVTIRDSTFNGYYKFLPQNKDTLTIGVMMFYQGIQVGWGFFQDSATVSTYTKFSVPIGYSGSFLGTPDSATILLFPFQGGGNPHGNSILFVDDLSFNNTVPTSISEIFYNEFEINNYPNPFSSSTKIEYALPTTGNVIIKLYDVTGREIMTLFNGTQQKGDYSILCNAAELNNGIYQLVIQSENQKQNKKIIVQK